MDIRPEYGDKTRFVLSHGPNVKPRDIVKLASQAGLQITSHYVYHVRSQAGVVREKPVGPFLVLALEIGLRRARELLLGLQSASRRR